MMRICGSSLERFLRGTARSIGAAESLPYACAHAKR